jgi:glycosyltransferase involved in cell wall biosynthesis
VFRHVADLYAGAPVFTTLFDPRVTGDLVDAARVHTSGLQRVPGASRYFRYFAPFYPAAFERFDLSAYDVIVSTTTAWAKGVRFRPDAVHACYIHTVSRFAFAYDQYVGGLGVGTLARPLVGRLVAWDREAAKRPTAFIANSRNVAERVRTHYGRDSYVVHCPVDVERYTVVQANRHRDCGLRACGRSAAHRRRGPGGSGATRGRARNADVVSRSAFRRGPRCGDGRRARRDLTGRRRLRPRSARGERAGEIFASDTMLRALYRRASVVLVPSFAEGFGLVAVEALAFAAITGAPPAPYASTGRPAAFASSGTRP